MSEEYSTSREILEILNRAALKMELLDYEDYIKRNNLIAVTSPNIFEPNSNKFHPKGLFSEEIFGSITSMERFAQEAIISLNTKIISPTIFATNIQKKSLYTSILSSKQYAIFDENECSFALADPKTPKAGTGYQFFIEHLPRLADAPAPSALRAGNLHKLLVKNKERMSFTQLICLPAGLRDLDLKSARLSKDDINKLYMSVINLAASLSRYSLSEDPIFDGIRYQMQLRVADIYDYLMDIISGKNGFLQKHYGARKIAFSTRNVISVGIAKGDTPDDSTIIKSDETAIPLLNLIKCFQPFFINYVKKKLYGELFLNTSGERVTVTDPKTLGLTYITLKPAEINKYTTVEGVTKMINQFKHIGFRESPVSIRDSNGKNYWLLVTYTEGDRVYISKTAEDLRRVVEGKGGTFKIGEVKPFLWTEAMYLAGVMISNKKYGFITRYPVLGDGSIYPTKLHLTTTNPDKSAEVIFDSGFKLEVPHYPILGKPYYESIALHGCRLEGLGADFDGDTVSASTTWVKESNEDIAANSLSISNVIGANMKLKIGAGGDIVSLVIYNLSRQDAVA